MKRLYRILLWLAGIVTLLIIVGALLPGTAAVSRSVTIKAPAGHVFGVLNDLKTYNAWMPWNQLDPAMKIEFSPVTKGRGAYYTWKSDHPKVGNGKLSIIATEPGKLVNTSIEFGGFDRAATAGWELVENNGTTEVTRSMTTDLTHNPFNRWFGLFFDKMIGPDFEKGLAQLKSKIENGSLSVQEPSMTIDQQVRPAFLVLTIMDTAQASGDIGPKLQKAYGEMGKLMNAEKLMMQGMPLAWYYSDKAPYILEAAVAVDKLPANTAGRIHFRKMQAGNAVVAHYFGPYESVSIAYNRIADWIKSNNLKPNGAPYEVYIDDPTTKKSMYEVQTDIVQPVE
ncbi:SRPBCC family protein [Flavihumibacter fluvii]|uniref:SRPBCC family protein n=1 Tax=Flavihumibacter fluvii TaxID=2838157 RepID=UPI001BDF20D1|nr:SRPBCC family protein [Flavihumibacter fluvii]ULQ53921.1 SRPBCC family protein [Flavihumibacter fluvii]